MPNNCPIKQELLTVAETDFDGLSRPIALFANPEMLDISCDPECNGPDYIHRTFLGRTSILGFDLGYEAVCTKQNLTPETTDSL